MEQTINELKQGMQALQNAQSRNAKSAQEFSNTRSSCTTVRTGPQNTECGLISLLSEDEEESEQTPNPRPIYQEVIQCSTPITHFTGFNFMSTNFQTENQPQVDRERRQSRALQRSTPSRRGRSRSSSPVGSNSANQRNRESSPSGLSVNHRRTSRMSASSTQTSSSTSGSSTNTQGNVNSPVVRPRRRRRTRQINHGAASSSSQVDTARSNMSSDSDGSERPNTSTSTEASSGIATSPHSSPDYSSSDDSYNLLFPDSTQWYQDLANRYISEFASIAAYGTGSNRVTATSLP